MSLPGPPTALETLLILRGLQTYGSESPALESLSQALKSSNVVAHNPNLDDKPFEPKALKSIYIRLLKKEVKLKSQNDGASDYLQDGLQNHGEEGKLSSPPLETIEEAEHYSYLIPRLATKVYNQYRESTIKAIEDEECRYRLLQKDIQEIERGEWDSRLEHHDIAPKRDPKGLSSIQTLLRDEPEENDRPSRDLNGTSSARLPLVYQQQPSQPSALTLGSQPQAIPYANSEQNTVVPNNSGLVQHEPLPTITGSPRRAPEAAYTPHEPPSTTPKLLSQPGSADNGGPFFPPPQHSQQGYRMSSPPQICFADSLLSLQVLPLPQLLALIKYRYRRLSVPPARQ